MITTTILVVEDDKDIRDVLEEVLSEEGHRVTHAPDGAAALSMLRGGFRPEVIVLDLAMPVMSGEELLDFLVREFPDIPIVVCTARRHVRLPHVRAVLYKPFSLTMLNDMVYDAMHPPEDLTRRSELEPYET